MVKIQECNKGCKKLITVQFDVEIGKYVPYEVDLSGNATQRHNCPNSQYNKQQGGQVTQQTPKFVPETTTGGLPTGNIPQDRPSLEATLLNQISQKIDLKFDELKKYIESLTVMDTPKFTGQMQQFHDDILPFLKTNFKIASELEQDKARDEKWRKEQEQIAKWNEAKQINAEEDDDNQRMEDAGI